MKVPNIRLFLTLAFLLFSCTVLAQEKGREVEIRKNVKLVEMSPAPETPDDLIKEYQTFLPMLIQSLKESTTDQSDECTLTLRVNAGFKAVGAAKIKRPTADITAFRKNAKTEYSGRLILYSYITSGPVSKEEASQFLKKQILDVAECH
jgi:hypothetical protein